MAQIIKGIDGGAMENIDLKLLKVFVEIYKTRSISQAAENLDLGQPAVSMSLAKLRKHFNDSLFVRTSEGMAPTPHAQDVIHLVREAIHILNLTLGYEVVFDPLTSTRTFNLSMTDFGARIVLPGLLERLRKEAPYVRINLTGLSENTPRLLEMGEVDLAIGLLPELGPGFFQQKLLTDKFVCLVCANHPRIKGKLTMAQFQSERHVVVAIQGAAYSIVERALDELKISRTIGVTIPNFLGIPSAIQNTEYLATVPERYALALEKSGRFNVPQLPFKMPSYKVMQHWHERFSRDLAAKWLRGIMVAIFKD